MSSIAPTIDNPPPESKLRRRLHACLTVALVVPWFTGCESGMNVKDTTRTFRTVVIDAGHGGHDTGARSRGGGMEKNAALDTALRLDPKLRAAGFNTVLTRRGDYFIPLGERTRISNRQEDSIFVSVHYNHAKNRSAHGVETFYRSRPSRKIAASIQGAICSLPGVASRGVKTANFWVLRRNEYPAVLVEGGFFSNPAEAKRCANPAYREAVADAIARAIITVRGPFEPINPPAPAPAPAPQAAGIVAAPAAGIPASAGNSPPPASR